MTTRMNTFFTTLLAAVAATIMLSGCAMAPTGVLYAMQYAPMGYVAYQYLPEGAEAKLAYENGTLNARGFKSVRRVAVYNPYAIIYLQDEADSGRALFDSVIESPNRAVTDGQAARLAKNLGADAFLRVTPLDAQYKQGIISSKWVLGKVQVTLVTRDGQKLYEQEASIEQKASSSTPDMSTDQVNKALAEVVIKDMREGHSTSASVAQSTGNRDESWLEKAKRKFNAVTE